jgi:hypothetical protein
MRATPSANAVSTFGFANQTWNNAVEHGDVVARARAIPMEELLVAGRVATSRYSLKLRLLATGLKRARCEKCGLGEWRGRPLSLALHHVNGDRHDNRLANLELLCPNCHSHRQLRRTQPGPRRRLIGCHGPGGWL